MSARRYNRWRKLQKQAAANFKPITITYTIDSCPDCYGGLPQGNESAWAKGCHDCRVRDQCGTMTEIVNDASLTKKEWEEQAKRDKEYMNPPYWQKKYGKGWTGKLPT
jgi:hypothetical protein